MFPIANFCLQGNPIVTVQRVAKQLITLFLIKGQPPALLHFLRFQIIHRKAVVAGKIPSGPLLLQVFGAGHGHHHGRFLFH